MDRFKFRIQSFGKSIPIERHSEIVESFKWLDWEGQIDLISPQVEVVVLFHMKENSQSDHILANAHHIYVGRLVSIHAFKCTFCLWNDAMMMRLTA